jgi:acyl-CoA ligase (AMP-forming) (exosortase A-associated)
MQVNNKLPRLLPELAFHSAERNDSAAALKLGSREVTYGELAGAVRATADGLRELGLARHDRLGIFLPKSVENVVALLATTAIGGVFVPINPVLKPDQVCHILRDCDARVLVTSRQRLRGLLEQLPSLPHLSHVILVDVDSDLPTVPTKSIVKWSDLQLSAADRHLIGLENDMAGIFYTSGSTGKPKGVILSHRNMVTGALSVAAYLENRADDRILSLLPLSFDAGFSQLTTAFSVGARVVLLNYLVPQDVVRVCEQESITGITGVPPLWMQLVDQSWPTTATRTVRYFANTGGKMPRDTLTKLRATFTNAKPFLMYGLTEAFRSTYLPPSEVEARPDSIGRAIPNVEIQVVRPDGTPCGVDEPGELVHRGPLVSLGYWNDPAKTAERFRPAPGQPPGLPFPELAVWSGDTVKLDAEGYLYFIGRKDDMIKTSGYRISPTEIEELAFESGLVSEAVAVGMPHETLGQSIVLLAKPLNATTGTEQLTNWYRLKVPLYMVPHTIEWRDELPRNPNGKIDRVTVRSLLDADETRAPK